MSEGARRYFLRKRESRELLAKLAQAGVKVPPQPRANVEVAEAGGARVFLLEGMPLAAEREGVLFPLLLAPEALEDLPSVVVDMGAIPHICNGAHVMAPGVVEVRGDFKAGALVKVLDERHGKAIAVGQALVSSSELRAAERGRVVRNLHYVGDKLWRLAKELTSS